MIDRLLTDLHRGRWVHGIHPEVSEMLIATEDACHRFNSLMPSDIEARCRIITDILGSIGHDFLIHSPFRCDFGKHIHIGDNFVANFGLTILDEAPVTIGHNVFIGPGVSIYTITHAMLPDQRNEGIMKALPVTIESDVWICGGVTILPGVTIGRGAVIGAGSVVTDDVPPMHLAMGNPCRPVRPITESDRVRI